MTGASANGWLLVGALCSGAAALLHVGCIVFGAPWYRFFGAGERMAQMAETGSLYPTIITLGIVLVLSLWSAYALSGAGLLPPFPLSKLALLAISGIFLIRGLVGFYFATAPIMGNSATFWLWSSAICTAVGLIHIIGLAQVWSRL